jgi:hypothetical protein
VAVTTGSSRRRGTTTSAASGDVAHLQPGGGGRTLTVEWRGPARAAMWAAVVLELVTGLPAIPSGIQLARTGMGMDTGWISHSLLPDYTIPGILLAVLIGGGMCVSAVLTLRRPPETGPLAAVMGVLLLVWLAIETLIVGWHGGPQAVLDPVYAAVGVALVVIGGRLLSFRLG